MFYRVKHTTTYLYSDTVSICHNELHLTPRDFDRQRTSEYRLLIRPKPVSISRRADFFGNEVASFSIQAGHQRLTVTTKSIVDVAPAARLDPAATPGWETVRDGLPRDRNPEALSAYQYAFDSPCVRCSSELADYALPSFTPGRPILAAAADLMRRIHTEFRYDPTATSVNTPPSEVLRTRRGVCQDFAHLAIGCLRSLGLASRYVSGYLLTTPPPGKPRLVGADASHAWFSVYTPDCGWVDFDPTNNIRPSDQHVTLAWGRDYSDVCPIKGVFFGGGQQVVQVSVDVTPLEGSSP